MLGSFRGTTVENTGTQYDPNAISHKDDTNYFNDGKRKIDYVLAVPNEKIELIKSYLEQLQNAGLQIEIDKGKAIENIHFIKIHASDSMIWYYTRFYSIDVTMNNPNFTWHVTTSWCVLHTALTCKRLSEQLRKRNNLIGIRPMTFTSAERIMIVEAVMSNTPYNKQKKLNLYGYTHLLEKGIVKAAYALHDGTWHWTYSGELNDRQLLYKFWAHITNYYKYQPLSAVEKYFGTEIALFYGFIGFYNHMLIPIAIIGVIFWLISFIQLLSEEFEEFCALKDNLCPLCQDLDKCPIYTISDFCGAKALNLIFDNTPNVVYAMLVSIWSIVFLARWRRYENVLKFQWNIHRLKYDSTVRYQYLSEANVTKHSRFTRKIVKEVSFLKRLKGYFMTYVSFLILTVVNYAIIFILMLFNKFMIILVKSNPNFGDFISFLAALIDFTFLVSVIQPMMIRLAVRLSHNECHRTQKQFDDSVVYKTCVLTIPSFYGLAFYLSLFKGRFFTKPIEVQHWYDEGGIPANECSPAGCLADTSILLMTMLITSTIIGFSKIIARTPPSLFLHHMVLKVIGKTFLQRKELESRIEQDYVKVPTTMYIINDEFTNIMVHYAMLTFFISASPLIPAIICIRNGISLRLTGYNLLQFQQRVTPKKVPSIGAWNRVLVIITFFGIFTNGVIIGFCTTFIPRNMYLIKNHWQMKGFVKHLFLDSTMTVFTELKGYYLPKNMTLPELCVYRGYDFISYANDALHGSTDYWSTLINTLLFVLVFENVMLIIAALVFFVMPPLNCDLKQRMEEEEKEMREIKIKTLNKMVDVKPNTYGIVQDSVEI